MFSQPRHVLLAFALALSLLFAQLAVAAHGVVHPHEDGDAPHSQVCEHLIGHGLGSALPSTHTFHLDANVGQAAVAPPCVPRLRGNAQSYHARAPPRV